MFWVLHIVALIFFFPALFLTIIGHIIYSQQRKKSDEISQVTAQIEKSREESRLATQLELQWNANRPKQEKETDTSSSIAPSNSDEKWEVAKKYLNEVKDGLNFINSKIPDTEEAKLEAENSLKEVFNQLGVSSINQSVLDNIIAQFQETELIDEPKIVDEKPHIDVSPYILERIQDLYLAVSNSQLSQVEALLSENDIKSAVTPEDHLKLKSIAKKRGDKKLFSLINRLS